MPTFTLELYRVLDLYPEGDNPTYENIGLNAYPIFDEAYRDELNQKIVDHYYMREIGQETVSMFKFAMKRKMNEIMPLYNQLYKSTLIEFDPLATMDIRNVVTGESATVTDAEGHSESSNINNSGSRAVQSNTPQVLLAGNKDYATSAADSTSESEGTALADENSNSNVESTNNSTSETKGYQGIPSELLMSYRASLLNVDMMIIAELQELFMLVWNNGDTYSGRKGYFYR